MRTLPPAAAAAVDVLAAASVAAAAAALVAVAAVAAAPQADEVLEAAFFLGIGEEATRARRERERIVDEKRMFAVVLVLKTVEDRYPDI